MVEYYSMTNAWGNLQIILLGFVDTTVRNACLMKIDLLLVSLNGITAFASLLALAPLMSSENWVRRKEQENRKVTLSIGFTIKMVKPIPSLSIPFGDWGWDVAQFSRVSLFP